MIEELERNIPGFKIPQDLESEDVRQMLIKKCDELGVVCTPPKTVTRLLDKMVGHFIEDTIVHPTFLLNHPMIMSPLAKYHRTKPHLTERFELFMCQHEYANAYTELNQPIVQRQRFELQAADKKLGDAEAQVCINRVCDQVPDDLKKNNI